MRMTHTLVQVAMVLLDGDKPEHWGYEMSKTSGVRSGAIYPMLNRMIDKGWITCGWEDPATSLDEGRPARRYFGVTETGKDELKDLLRTATGDARFGSLRDQIQKILSNVEVQA